MSRRAWGVVGCCVFVAFFTRSCEALFFRKKSVFGALSAPQNCRVILCVNFPSSEASSVECPGIDKASWVCLKSVLNIYTVQSGLNNCNFWGSCWVGFWQLQFEENRRFGQFWAPFSTLLFSGADSTLNHYQYDPIPNKGYKENNYLIVVVFNFMGKWS